MNKSILLLISLLFVTTVILGQNEKISEINQKIQKALANENYEMASQLKKEKYLRLSIDSLVKAEDYEGAAEVRKEIDNLHNISKTDKNEIKNDSKGDDLNLSSAKKTLGFVKPDKGYVAVYFVRKSVYAAAWRINVFDNRQYIGGTISGTYMRYECDPGKHLFWFWGEDNKDKFYLPADLELNKTYIIEISASLLPNKQRREIDKGEFPYEIEVIPASMSDSKKLNKLISVVKKNNLRSYPEHVIIKLNSEYEFEIRKSLEEFESVGRTSYPSLKPNSFISEELIY